jgi:hypothetical protein
MAMRFGGVTVRMAMNVISVWVDVIMLAIGAHRLVHPARKTPQIQESEENQHQPHREFQRQTEARGDDNAEHKDCPTDNQHGERVADSPCDADQRRVANGALATHDCRHGNYVVCIRGMAHPKKEAQEEDG